MILIPRQFKRVKQNNHTRLLLASGSRILLEGISNIIRASNAGIEIITHTAAQNIEESLAQIKPQFLLLDNRMLDYDIRELLNLIKSKSPGTEVIVFKHSSKKTKLNFPGVIYITRKTKTSDLISMVKNSRL